MLGVKLAWEWVKKNWKFMLLTFWSALVWFLSRRSSQAAIDAMQANKISYETQIDSLKKEHKSEIKKREQLNLKYRETLVKIEEKYRKKENDLSRAEKRKVKEIVKKAKDKPIEINKKIEDLFGFASDS